MACMATICVAYLLKKTVLNMKRLLTILTFAIALGSATGQSEVKFLNIFGEGDLATATDLLAGSIRLCIEDEVSEVSRSKALNELNAFLKEHTILKKKILHNGKSTDADSSYKVARIKTEEGTYRVFAYSEKNGSVSEIKEIRIDKM